MTKTKENLESFLGELTELSKKHGLYIGGCGCCGSPYIGEDVKNVGESTASNFSTSQYVVSKVGDYDNALFADHLLFEYDYE